jgi:hypothetical protein
MRIALAIVLMSGLLLMGEKGNAQDTVLEGVLRSQVFNKVFEGFDFYHLVIEEDHAQSDGSREVTVVASGKFLENTKRMKVLFLIVGEQVIGGQVLEGTGLPPCLTPEESRKSSL